MEVVMHTATHPQSSSSALRGRMGRGALVLGAHVAIIYGVAASLGIVRSPVQVEPMQAVLITETEPVEQKPLEPVKPELATPSAEVAPPELMIEVPIEEALPVEAVPENAITASAAPSSPPYADLAVTHSTQPVYPPASRRMNEEGVVALAVRVDERGRPIEVRVEQSSGFPRLDQAAVEGLRKWRFQAAVRDGAATSAWTTVRVRFRLDA
jgi:protein TonB